MADWPTVGFLSGRPLPHGSTPKGTPEILAGIGVGYGKVAYKSCNICETGQDRTKVTIED